jgi:hypothetical protein
VRAEGRFWGLEDGSARFIIDSDDRARIGRPIIDATTSEPTTIIISNPGTVGNGLVDVLAKNDLYGADVWLRRNWVDNGRFRLDLLGGYQFTRMDDSVSIVGDSTIVDPMAANPGLRTVSRDLFIAQNEFHGGSLGFVAEWRRNALSLEVLGKIAFGDLSERIIIDGFTVQTDPSGAVTFASRSLLAARTNEGRYEAHRFTVVPELNANFVIHLNPAWRLTAGYSLLYWTEAVLAGDQIDRRVNLTQVPGIQTGSLVGVQLPTFLGVETTYLVQGMNLGVDYRW